jgi:hypothetical protein
MKSPPWSLMGAHDAHAPFAATSIGAALYLNGNDMPLS